MIGCSINFDNLRSCLSHLARCAWLSNSWYWCPFCERGEHFAEPAAVLSSCPKPEPSSEVFDYPRRPAPGKTNFNNTTAQLLRHLGSKLGLLPQSQTLRLPTSMDRGEENDQDITDHGIVSLWDQSTASLSELDALMGNPPELEAPHSQPSEPQANWQRTNDRPVGAELSDHFDSQLLELVGSTTFNSNAESRRPSSKPFSNNNHPGPTDPTRVFESPEQLPQNQASAKEEFQLETPAWRSRTAPSRSTFPRYGYSTDRPPIDDSTMYSFEQATFFSPNGPLSPPVHPYTGPHYDPTTTQKYCVSLQPGQRTIESPLGRFHQAPTSTIRNRSIGQETPLGDFQDQLYNNQTSIPGMAMPYAFREPNLSSPSLALARYYPIPGPHDAGKRPLYPVPLSSEDAHHTTDIQEQLRAISPLGSLEANFISSSRTVSPLLLPDGALPPLPLSNRSSGDVSQTNPSTQPTSTEVSPVSADFTAATTAQSRKAKGISKCPYCEALFKGTYQDRKSNLNRHIRYSHGDEKFKCPICATECSRPDNLLKHRRTVHGDGLLVRRSNAHKVRRSL